jgi:hypothetical protein
VPTRVGARLRGFAQDSSMPSVRRKHPVIRLIAVLAIVGGLITMGNSLTHLHSALERHNWPATELHRSDQQLTYRVGEQDYVVPADVQQELAADTRWIFYDPEQPGNILLQRPNFWWPLYLSMAGLIVLYAGLHLFREKDRDLRSLSFE